jgi:hypothetical protein
MAMAYGGAKVLLVDADLRRPSVHDGFGLENRVGLSDVLSGRTPLTSAVSRLSSPDNLWVMTAGEPPHNPSELLGSKRMESLFEQMRTGPFEWVIIDTPPVLAVTDASILAREATGVAFRARGEHDAAAPCRARHRNAGDRRPEDPGRRAQPRRIVTRDVFLLGLPPPERARGGGRLAESPAPAGETRSAATVMETVVRVSPLSAGTPGAGNLAATASRRHAAARELGART